MTTIATELDGVTASCGIIGAGTVLRQERGKEAFSDCHVAKIVDVGGVVLVHLVRPYVLSTGEVGAEQFVVTVSRLHSRYWEVVKR